MLLDTGAVLDDHMIYWDVRPSSKFPTLEVRVADVPATVAETVLLATLTRAAVMTALENLERGLSPPRLPAEHLRALHWRAARDGLDGRAIKLLGHLVEQVRPALESLGEHDHVSEELRRLARDGNGATRQLRAWRQRGEVADVITAAAAATLQ